MIFYHELKKCLYIVQETNIYGIYDNTATAV